MSQQAVIIGAHITLLLMILGYLGWALWQALDCVRTGEIFHARMFAISCVLAFVLALADVVIMTS